MLWLFYNISPFWIFSIRNYYWSVIIEAREWCGGRINSSQALSPKLISRQRVGCILVSSIPHIFHRVVQPSKNPHGVVLTRALRKLSSSDDWYGFRSPYFAPPILTASNLSLSSLPTTCKNDGFATLRCSTS